MTEQEETIGAGSMWCSCDCARVMQRSPALSRHYLGHGVRYSPDSVGGVDAVEALAVGELVAYQSTSRHPYVGTTWQGAVLTRLRGRLRAQVAFACGRVTTVQRFPIKTVSKEGNWSEEFQRVKFLDQPSFLFELPRRLDPVNQPAATQP